MRYSLMALRQRSPKGCGWRPAYLALTSFAAVKARLLAL